MIPSQNIKTLIDVMAALRTPVTGCPWDLEQTFATIAPYTIEEAYEVADAIARDDLEDLKDELGDLLLQVAYHARMAEEVGAFAFGDVVEAITAKMIRRHPHVFGPDAGAASQDAIDRNWHRIKAEEKAERAARRGIAADQPPSLLASVRSGQPALARALALQDKAATVGFDWNDPRAVLAKIREEVEEIEAAIDRDDKAEVVDEAGDLLFAVVNIVRHMKADPETALRATNTKFARRFVYIEQALAARGKTPAGSSLEEMDALWNEAKSVAT